MTYPVVLQLRSLLNIRLYHVACDMRLYGMECDIIARMEHHWLSFIGILWHFIWYRNSPSQIRSGETD